MVHFGDTGNNKLIIILCFLKKKIVILNNNKKIDMLLQILKEYNYLLFIREVIKEIICICGNENNET